MNIKSDIEVSVIIPNYNYSRYIKKCINSVLESKFDFEVLEIIIVDDASTDDSINIIEQIENNTKAKIHLIKQNINLGLAKARNTGIKNASGNYLFFLDSDNYIDKNCLKTHYDFLKKNPEYIACYAPIQKFDDQDARMRNVFSNQEYDYEKLLYGNYIDAMAMIKKEDLIEVGLYDEEMPHSGWEDYELWLRMGNRNKKIYFIDGKPLSYYRIHDDSMISNIQTNCIDKLASYINKKYALNTKKESKGSPYTKIQIFWANIEQVFLEECSLFQFIQLSDISKEIKFELGTFNESIYFIRFDLGDEVGLINIHHINIKDNLQNIKWCWDKYTLHNLQNLLLLENKKLWPDRILQISQSIDPSFTIATNDVLKELSLSGFSIEIALSSPDFQQMNFLNSHTKPLTCYSDDEFTVLQQQVSNLNLEKSALSVQLDSCDRNFKYLENENLKLSENSILFQQFSKQLNEDKANLNDDKFLLSKELDLKNDLIIKAANKIETLEEQLAEKIKKDIAQLDAQGILIQAYDEKIRMQEDLFNKMQNAHTTQIKLLEDEVKKISLSEAEHKTSALYYQEKFEVGENLSISLQRKIKVEQENIIDLTNQIATIQSKLLNLEFICATIKGENNQLLRKNKELEKEVSKLEDFLRENLKQKQELIVSINLHLEYIERVDQEKKEILKKYTTLQDEFTLTKFDKQEIEMNLTKSNKKSQEYELVINELKENIRRLENQKWMTFIKGKITTKANKPI